ncbi:carbon storage regulator [Thioalkalivibrio denitrificans]|uniref:Translational regulator CsrA n=2 Tax=Thioalkalivibrio denitrificans TaxID=108003 RepID=A0A1V3NUR5_9GAMM|nr:carbon storage regulator CsrA [Thioalkalivibrio denitrificans]OOG28879.1 carbon storage regulator [Thioalkalivibrio denitrificans]
MLILTRRPGEVLRIGDDVEVHVLGVNGNQIRVGIAAPQDTRILREELLRGPERKSTARSGRQPLLGLSD